MSERTFYNTEGKISVLSYYSTLTYTFRCQNPEVRKLKSQVVVFLLWAIYFIIFSLNAPQFLRYTNKKPVVTLIDFLSYT